MKTAASFTAKNSKEQNSSKRRILPSLRPPKSLRDVPSMEPSNLLSRETPKEQCPLTHTNKDEEEMKVRKGPHRKKAHTAHTSRVSTTDQGGVPHKNMGERKKGGKVRNRWFSHNAPTVLTNKAPTQHPSTPPRTKGKREQPNKK